MKPNDGKRQLSVPTLIRAASKLDGRSEEELTELWNRIEAEQENENAVLREFLVQMKFPDA